MKRFVLPAVFCIGAIFGAVVGFKHAQAQSGGQFTNCAPWPASQTFIRNGNAYTPKGTVCVGYDGKLYLATTRGDTPSTIRFMPMWEVPIDW